MPRHPRLFVFGATHHVYCRVARGEFVFDSPSEAAEFIDVLETAMRNVAPQCGTPMMLRRVGRVEPHPSCDPHWPRPRSGGWLNWARMIRRIYEAAGPW